MAPSIHHSIILLIPHQGKHTIMVIAADSDGQSPVCSILFVRRTLSAIQPMSVDGIIYMTEDLGMLFREYSLSV
jgi:hypothetical protein